jgi:hypothetical protein
LNVFRRLGSPDQFAGDDGRADDADEARQLTIAATSSLFPPKGGIEKYPSIHPSCRFIRGGRPPMVCSYRGGFLKAGIEGGMITAIRYV